MNVLLRVSRGWHRDVFLVGRPMLRPVFLDGVELGQPALDGLAVAHHGVLGARTCSLPLT